MHLELIPISVLTKDDLKRRDEFHSRRNLYNKYTNTQLENWMKIDLYEALDLDGYRESEIPTDILQYAVKKKSAVYHPAKNRGKELAFLIISKAGVVLSNSKYRKTYDSCFLDESLPEDREYEPDEFFREFTAVFNRNGLFSEEKPVPDLSGDLETFYKFWKNFRTTRTYEDPEHVFDVCGAVRRQNAEKNKDAMQQRKIKDLQRIQELVKLAIKRDPRIKKKPTSGSSWDEAQLKSLVRFNSLFGKAPNKIEVITMKLNDLFLTKRSVDEVKMKLNELKK